MNNARLDPHSLFEYVYAFAPIGIALLDTDGTFIRANPALCRMLGYAEDVLVSRNFRVFTYPEDKDITLYPSRQLLDGLVPTFSVEKRYLHQNGEIVWASLHVSLVRDQTTDEPLYFISHIVDITEKKETEQMYRLISENAREIIYCATMDGICTYCSPSVRELLGYEPEELIGQSGKELIHPDDYEHLMRSGASDTSVLRYRNLHKNGDYVWFETTYKVIEVNRGEKRVLSVGRDITERKKNEDLLAEAQKIALIGSCEWDLLHDEVILSDQLYELFGLDSATKIDHLFDLLRFVHPGDQKEFKKQIEAGFRSGELNFEFRQVLRDRSIRYLHARGIITLDEQGKPVRMKGTIQDVTERKKTELKLQESMERYNSLKKYNHDAVISLDLKGNIVHGNAVAEQMTGYRMSELAGQSAAVLIGREHMIKILSGSSHDASVENSINRFMHRDGHEVEVLTTIAPIIISNENAGFYIIAKDITEQKKLLIAKEAAESTNKAKSEFLAMMSHEIRTPMNGVLGMAELLSEADNLNPEQKEYIEIILKSGNILMAIINDILDFSKIDSGKTELTEHIFDVRDCIADAMNLLSAPALEKRLELIFSVSPGVPHEVTGDPERLKQVLMNLIGNAIKFTEAGSVSVSVTQTGSPYRTVELEFTVRDTGIGIPAHEVDLLFQPFYQVHHSLNRNYEGTGLGLAISKKLVELMGGSIRIEQPAGPGAAFVFTVPFQSVVSSALRATEKREEPEALPVTLNILVAEDNVINQKVITRMLEKMGHSVTIADDGEQAVNKAVNGSYDMIFMDVHMPMMDGLEAAQTIKGSMPQNRCPLIVAMTANALIGDREKCLAAGMDEYISKPLKMDTVSKVIHQFVRVPTMPPPHKDNLRSS